MRVGRSLSPGKVFIEMNGVLRKVEPDQINHSSAFAKSGWRRIRDSLVQWWVSDSPVVLDNVSFPVAFLEPPRVFVDVQGAAATVSDVSSTGFQLRTRAETVHWSAVGRGAW